MKCCNLKILIYIIVIIVLLIFSINYYYTNRLDIKYMITSVSYSVTILSFLSFILKMWLWKLKFLQGYFILIPNLNGKWEGEIKSDWINPKTNKKIPAIPVSIEIKQNLFHISIKVITKEMTSYSKVASFYIDKEQQQEQLFYTYTSIPLQSIQERSRIHYGSVVLDIGDNCLSGIYWTNRKTSGDIHVKKITC